MFLESLPWVVHMVWIAGILLLSWYVVERLVGQRKDKEREEVLRETIDSQQRTHHREATPFEVLLGTDRRSHQSEDLSVGGCSFLSSQPAEPGQRFPIELHSPFGKVFTNINGQVVGCQPIAGNKHRIRIQFVKLPPNTAQSLEKELVLCQREALKQQAEPEDDQVPQADPPSDSV